MNPYVIPRQVRNWLGDHAGIVPNIHLTQTLRAKANRIISFFIFTNLAHFSLFESFDSSIVKFNLMALSIYALQLCQPIRSKSAKK